MKEEELRSTVSGGNRHEQSLQLKKLSRNIDLFVRHRYETLAAWELAQMNETALLKPVLTESAIRQVFPRFQYDWAQTIGLVTNDGIDRSGFLPFDARQLKCLYRYSEQCVEDVVTWAWRLLHGEAVVIAIDSPDKFYAGWYEKKRAMLNQLYYYRILDGLWLKWDCVFVKAFGVQCLATIKDMDDALNACREDGARYEFEAEAKNH